MSLDHTNDPGFARDKEMFEGGQAIPEEAETTTALLTFAEGNDPEITSETVKSLGQRIKQCK